MRTSIKLKGYKLYTNGTEFLSENEEFLNQNTNTKITTAFFLSNAQLYHALDQMNYAFQFYYGEEKLLLLKCYPYNALLWGSKDLASYAGSIVAEHDLEVSHLLGEPEIIELFLDSYLQKMGGEKKLEHSMQIMILTDLKDADTSEVFVCGPENINALAMCWQNFEKEVFQRTRDISELKENLNGQEKFFFAYAVDGEIVSIAKKTRDDEQICAVSHVYTIPSHRGKGYARKVVAATCKNIMKEGKLPYLYVDNNNPISNHLYLKLGFQYLIHQAQYQYIPSTIKTAIFAGGCFWCIAEPFYSLDGVQQVISGFIGGDIISPSYKEVKRGSTGHKEAIMILYDTEKITYSDLLEIYFSHIDPFDPEGQFIDRGENYTCGVYTSNLEEQKLVEKMIQKLEQTLQKKAYVPVFSSQVFYPAEEEHQDYALKNPDAMEEEIKRSGRKK